MSGPTLPKWFLIPALILGTLVHLLKTPWFWIILLILFMLLSFFSIQFSPLEQ